jgi:predicted HAD superfamily Cof-like phosphohydrolase
MGETLGTDPQTLEESVINFMNLAGQIRPGNYYRDEIRASRVKMLRSEFEEYLGGEDEDDVVEIADGLADILVVAFGTLVAYFGPPVARQIVDEVCRNNLTKVDGTYGPTVWSKDGKKVLKPDGFQGPNIRGILAPSWLVDEG